MLDDSNSAKIFRDDSGANQDANQPEDETTSDAQEETQAKKPEEVLAEAQILWKKYFTLTKELLKFSDQSDTDLFVELVDQRGRLIEQIKALPENNYRESEECKAMIEQMIPMDKQIIYRARAWLNKSRRQNNTVRSYDITNSMGMRGTVFNRKY